METALYLYVFAPVLTAFVEWVLHEAETAGKRRLYFLARDGYPMYLAARELCEARGIPIECRYLKLSRYSLRVPSYHLMREGCLERICTDGIEVSFASVMRRAALTPQEERTLARYLGYEERFQKKLSRNELFGLKDQLRESPLFLEYTYAHSREAYENAAGYLAQEGLLSDIPYAVVDSGWTGTMQQTLRLLLEAQRPGIKVEGYYFGLYELPAGEREGYHAFYFSPARGLRRKAYFSNCLFEGVFSAPGGMTEGYLREGDRFLPVENPKGSLNREAMERNAKALLCYVRAYLGQYEEERRENGSALRRSSGSLRQKQEGAKAPGTCLRKARGTSRMAARLLFRFMGKPRKFEADIFGEYLFSDDVREDQRETLAADFSEEELRGQNFFYRIFVKLGLKKGDLKESAWSEGSIAKCGAHARRYFWHARAYKYFIYIRKTWKGVRNENGGKKR